MYHLHLIQRGERKPWWWTLCDMLIALVIGWTVLGLAEWAGIPFKGVQSLSIIAGWGGPHLIDRLIELVIRKYLGGPLPTAPTSAPATSTTSSSDTAPTVDITGVSAIDTSPGHH